VEEAVGGGVIATDGDDIDVLAGYFPHVERAAIEVMLAEVRAHLAGLPVLTRCD
jgi:hypothetical protein